MTCHARSAGRQQSNAYDHIFAAVQHFRQVHLSMHGACLAGAAAKQVPQVQLLPLPAY
jgi:hypothetical protein